MKKIFTVTIIIIILFFLLTIVKTRQQFVSAEERAKNLQPSGKNLMQEESPVFIIK